LTTGYLDGPSGLELGGWVWDPARPGVRLRVEIVIDGVLLRRCTAFNYRADLQDAGIGDGRHAWSVELPPFVFDGTPHTLEARTFPDNVPLRASPLRFQSRYTGSLDQIGEDGRTIIGTLRDESRSSAPLVADVFGDSRYLGHAPANPSLGGAFEIRLPESFDFRRVAKFELFARHGGQIAAATVAQRPPSRWWKHFRWKPQRHFDTAVGIRLQDFAGTYEVTVRDYSWICPRVDLVDETGRYCGEPTNIAGCEHCYRKLGPRVDWGGLLHHAGSVEEMRRQYREVLEKAELVHFPSSDAAERIRRYAPGIQRAVIQETPGSMPVPRTHRPGGHHVVAFLGDKHVLDACRWEAAKRGGIGFEFVEPGHPDAHTAFYANTSPDVDAAAVAMLIAAGHARIVTFDLGACAAHAHVVLPIHSTPGQILDALCHV